MLGFMRWKNHPKAWLKAIVTVVCICSHSAENRAGEPRAMSGTLQPHSLSGVFSTAFLINPATESLQAGLMDPFGLLPPERRGVVVQGELNGVELNGLPLLEVRTVLPEFWIQPASHQHFQKGPSAYSGYGRNLQPRDFAGVPLNERRAYQHDNGGPPPAQLRSGRETPPPAPLRVAEPRVSGEDLALRWQATPGLRYRLLAGATLDGEFELVQEFTVSQEKVFEVLLPRGAEQAFYILQAVQP